MKVLDRKMTSKSANNSSSSNENSFQNIVQYIEDYVDLVENIPNEIIRQVTRLHEQNHLYNQLSKKLDVALHLLVGPNEKGEEMEESDEEDKSKMKDDQEKELKIKKSNTDQRSLSSSKKNDSAKDGIERVKAMYTVQKCLLDLQEVSDEKLYIVQSILDQLDLKGRQLDGNFRSISISNNLGTGLSSKPNHENLSNQNNLLHNVNHHSIKEKDSNHEESGNNDSESNNTNTNNNASSKRSSSRRNFNNNNKHDMEGNGNGSNNNHCNSSKRGMKRGVKGSNKEGLKRNKTGSSGHSSKDMANNSPSTLYDEPPIDPDEPTYCLCEQVSFGEMICCDNSACAIEWFHFQCVALTTKPKGRWYCPNCAHLFGPTKKNVRKGDRSNIAKK